jgi:hypothetical protein
MYPLYFHSCYIAAATAAAAAAVTQNTENTGITGNSCNSCDQGFMTWPLLLHVLISPSS